MKTMRALVKPGREPGLHLEERPVPEPGTNEVLIKVSKAEASPSSANLNRRGLNFLDMNLGCSDMIFSLNNLSF